MNKQKLSIGVLSHQEDNFEKKGYFLALLLNEWRKQGYEIVYIQGIDTLPSEPQLLIQHVNLTVTPSDYISFSKNFPQVVNGAAVDISKKRVSRNLVASDDQFQGPVIVKTNENYGGKPERRYLTKKGGTALIKKAIDKAMPWTMTGYLEPHNYPVYDSVSQVPAAVWKNNRLIVEKFLPEKKGDLFCLRQWLFLGESEVSLCSYSSDRVIKSTNITHREEGCPIPDELRLMRKQLGFDYGKFDYGIVDSKVVLYDANRTPSTNLDAPSETVCRIACELSKGIASFL